MVAAVLLMTGTALATFSVVPYIKSIVRGKAKPRAISWAIWTLLIGLMAVVSWQQHQLSSAVLSTASAIGCLIVTLLALRHVRFEPTRLERYTLLGAAIGIVLWLLFDNPMLVLTAALTVDSIAYIPTYVNGWRNPYHESMTMFIISAFGSGLVLLAAVLDRAAMSGIVYPLYSVIFGSIMIAILMTRRQRLTYARQEPVIVAS
jgi:ABC-type cobalamin transport system permease subunit